MTNSEITTVIVLGGVGILVLLLAGQAAGNFVGNAETDVAAGFDLQQTTTSGPFAFLRYL